MAEAKSLCDFLCNYSLLKANRCVSHTASFVSIAVGRLAKYAAALVMDVTLTNAQIAAGQKLYHCVTSYVALSCLRQIVVFLTLYHFCP
ncbi:hypothetical protein SCA6_010701 [Theobroma cacao]